MAKDKDKESLAAADKPKLKPGQELQTVGGTGVQLKITRGKAPGKQVPYSGPKGAMNT